MNCSKIVNSPVRSALLGAGGWRHHAFITAWTGDCGDHFRATGARSDPLRSRGTGRRSAAGAEPSEAARLAEALAVP